MRPPGRRPIDRPDVLYAAGQTARLRTWPLRPDIAHLLPLDHHDQPGIHAVTRWLEQVRALGCTSVRTGALSAEARAPFERCGFRVIQRLALLELDLHHRSPAAEDALTTPTRRLTARVGADELERVALVDQAAFAPGWGLDAAALLDACLATPHHRMRGVTGADGQWDGFAITGRSGASGFVQRLAVAPRAQGRGVGRLLLHDGLQWLARRRAASVLVNTEETNHAALTLYGSAGFVPRADGLVVMELDLTGSRA